MDNTLAAHTFSKKHQCPSSEILIQYLRGSLYPLVRANVRVHLDSCDFCNAELQLLSKHLPYYERSLPAPVPSILVSLAGKLLPRRPAEKDVRRAA